MNKRLILLPLMLMSTCWMPAGADEKRIDRLIDVGGYRLRLHCIGQGSPAVIMDHGLGSSSNDWKRVQSNLSQTTQACTYDRAGYGQSDAGPMPRVSGRIAAELRTLLQRADIAAPYVLVGHSFGGYNMRMFAGLFPEQTAGLVLVDTPNEGQVDGFFENQIMRQIDPLGLLKWVWTPDLFNSLTEIDLTPVAPLIGFPAKTLQAILAELAGFKDSSQELRTADVYGETPLVIIMHGLRVLPNGTLGDDMEQEWMRLQREFSSQYRNSTFIVAPQSGHNVPLNQPGLVAEAIKRLIGNPASSANRHPTAREPAPIEN
ncbi:MAG: alpha/beta hydrolase [Pseudomonadota bacterium]